MDKIVLKYNQDCDCIMTTREKSHVVQMLQARHDMSVVVCLRPTVCFYSFVLRSFRCLHQCTHIIQLLMYAQLVLTELSRKPVVYRSLNDAQI